MVHKRLANGTKKRLTKLFLGVFLARLPASKSTAPLDSTIHVYMPDCFGHNSSIITPSRTKPSHKLFCVKYLFTDGPQTHRFWFTSLLTQVSRSSRWQFQAGLEMWALHKILSTILRKPRPTKPFFDRLFRTFLAKLDEPTSKI